MVGKVLSWVAVAGLLAALIGGGAWILAHPETVEARGGAGTEGTTSYGGRYRGAGTEGATIYGGGYGRAGQGTGELLRPEVTPGWNILPPSDLSAEEQAGLVWMREEEKLAHDVYVALYETWGLQTFNTIAVSEQAHMESVLGLLERYGIADPAAGKALGEFSNPDLQALYARLVAQGQASALEALKVGAYIEELDIADLQARLSQIDNADIQQVYTNLLTGSGSHLRAFVRVLEWQFGTQYTPQVLDEATYQSIIGTVDETGPVQRGWGRRGR